MLDLDGFRSGWDCIDRRVAAPVDDDGTFRWADPFDNGALPDLTDPATLGCLLALVREAWGRPRIGVYPFTTFDHTEVWGTIDDYRDGVRTRGATEAAALVAALEAAP